MDDENDTGPTIRTQRASARVDVLGRAEMRATQDPMDENDTGPTIRTQRASARVDVLGRAQMGATEDAMGDETEHPTISEQRAAARLDDGTGAATSAHEEEMSDKETAVTVDARPAEARRGALGAAMHPEDEQTTDATEVAPSRRGAGEDRTSPMRACRGPGGLRERVAVLAVRFE